jgi:hypothetical protein
LTRFIHGKEGLTVAFGEGGLAEVCGVSNVIYRYTAMLKKIAALSLIPIYAFQRGAEGILTFAILILYSDSRTQTILITRVADDLGGTPKPLETCL